MTDREMLEFAAKAAGLPHKWIPILGKMLHIIDGGNSDTWNPLTDDGDALRLMVRLRLHARQFPIVDDGFDVPLGMVEVWRVDDDDPMHVEFLRSGDDRLAATRRAIVRAAAEIGRRIAQQTARADLPEDNYYKTMAEAEEAGHTAAEIGRQMP